MRCIVNSKKYIDKRDERNSRTDLPNLRAQKTAHAPTANAFQGIEKAPLYYIFHQLCFTSRTPEKSHHPVTNFVKHWNNSSNTVHYAVPIKPTLFFTPRKIQNCSTFKLFKYHSSHP
jgi:hypothetical protein